MSKIFTHQELCEIAELWLKKDMKCCIALNNASGLKENPDAIGWRFTYGNLNKEGSLSITASNLSKPAFPSSYGITATMCTLKLPFLQRFNMSEIDIAFIYIKIVAFTFSTDIVNNFCSDICFA